MSQIICIHLQHEDYDEDADGIPNDIAVVELQQSVNISNEYMGLAKLPRHAEEFAGTEHCWIAGWGRHSKQRSLQAPNIAGSPAGADTVSRGVCRH